MPQIYKEVQMSKTLLLPYELIAVGGAKVLSGAEPQYFCVPISTEEETLFSCYFGMGFYDELKADLIDYAPLAIPFEPNVSYGVGDIILFDGYYKRVVQTTTGIETPDNSLYFDTPPKFNSTEYQNLWDDYLKVIIAYQVIAENSAASITQMSDTGLRVAKGETFEAPTQGQINIFVLDAQKTVRKKIRLMENYILARISLYPSFEFLRSTCEEKCGHCHVCNTSQTRLGYGQKTTNFSYNDL